MQQLERQLQAHGLHVGLLEGGGDVHVHVEEPLHGAALLRLLDLQLREEGDEPLEAALLPVDPEEVHLAQLHHLVLEVVGPPVGALGTRVPCGPVSEKREIRDETMNNEESLVRVKLILDMRALTSFRQNIKC